MIFHHPGILGYDFGPSHPLKPERMRRTLLLLEAWGIVPAHPGEGDRADLTRVHDADYVDVVFRAGHGAASEGEIRERSLHGDTPVFPLMGERSLDYVSGVARAAREVRDGVPVAICLDGGLHHAHRDRASGFCVFDDPAIAVTILRERFERVAYVDTDVHHGDGPEGIFRNDPSVLTVSIHEDGRTLFPGTGRAEETGTERSVLNLPMPAGTGEIGWFEAFRSVVPDKIRAFGAQAIVLQMGTDTHFRDPLAHLQVTQDAWLAAVREVFTLGLPLVAVGGGGYELTCVPRMWASAAATLLGVAYADEIPVELRARLGADRVSDGEGPDPSRHLAESRTVATQVRTLHGLE